MRWISIDPGEDTGWAIWDGDDLVEASTDKLWDVAGVSLVLQPAAIKKSAIAAGAEELFMTPLHENRHANDAIMHGIFFTSQQ